jgi:hypothetical protein
VHRLNSRDRRHASSGAPGQEFFYSLNIGPVRMRVAHVGREGFEEAHRDARRRQRRVSAPAVNGTRLEFMLKAPAERRGIRRAPFPVVCQREQFDLADVFSGRNVGEPFVTPCCLGRYRRGSFSRPRVRNRNR